MLHASCQACRPSGVAPLVSSSKRRFLLLKMTIDVLEQLFRDAPGSFGVVLGSMMRVLVPA